MDPESWYTKLTDEWSDPRSRGWFLVDSPINVLLVMTAYVIFSIKLGPALMKHRKPFKLDRIVQLYNLMQVVTCAGFAIQTIYLLIAHNYNFVCQPIKGPNQLADTKFAVTNWVYFMFKFADFVDTVFFILRRKFSHITFLHVYHHSLTFLFAWIFAKYYPGGQSMVTIILNTTVHVFMYTYYFIASLGPEYKKYLWWKRHITDIQLVQFVLVMLHVSQVFLYDCDYPKLASGILISHAVAMLLLFGKFYIKMYLTGSSNKSSEENTSRSLKAKIS